MYDDYKCELYARYIDIYGMVIQLDQGRPDGIGDAAWRTGLAAICMAIEGDEGSCLALVRSLSNCWRNGLPVGHPEWTQSDILFSRDQFYPQLAACFYAWKHGSDQLKAAAQDLLARFIDVLIANRWRFNAGEAAVLRPTARYILRIVAEAFQLRHTWYASGTSFSAYIRVNAARIAIAGDRPAAFYAIHNRFWQILLAYELRGELFGLEPNTRRLYRACAPHKCAPYFWIAKEEASPGQWLRSWPLEWNAIDYVWQRSKDQQRHPSSPSKSFPRLDYLVLYQLFNLKLPR